MTLTEKVAYLKGLVEGIGVDETTNQGKIMKAVLDVLDDMAFTVSDLEDSTSELYEEVEAIDEDLSSLEDEFYGDDEDDDDCCCDDDDCDCCCDDHESDDSWNIDEDVLNELELDDSDEDETKGCDAEAEDAEEEVEEASEDAKKSDDTTDTSDAE